MSAHRTDRTLADGRLISYYDPTPTERNAVDSREKEDRPGLGKFRLDPLTNEWVTIASHRQGRVFLPPKELCPLCPSSKGKATEIPEPSYHVAVFENRAPSYAAPISSWMMPEVAGLDTPEAPTAGRCEVICFADEHHLSLKDLTVAQIALVIDAWRDRTRELSQLPYVEHIFPFENRGEEVGVTLSHPHGQIYAYPYLPPKIEKMLAAAQEHKKRTGRILLDDIIAREIKDGSRIITRNNSWIVYVPYAARYPFEIHLAPTSRVADFTELSDTQSADLAPILKEVLQRLDGVFGIPMAYIASWYQAPVRTGRDVMRLHLQITSVRRAPGKLKYLSGSESAMGAFIMDVDPEQSAEQLRNAKI